MYSCKKYEDGQFTLRTPEKRLVRKWKADKLIKNEYVFDDNLSIEFIKKNSEHSDYNGTFTFTETYTDTISHSLTLNGNWKLSDDKNEIYLYYSYISSSNTNSSGYYITGRDNWIIRKLTKDKFSIDYYYRNIIEHIDFESN